MTFERITEEETKNLYITPAIRHAGWEPKQMRMETVINGVKESKYQFTPGRVIVRGDKAVRAKGRRTDYILVHKNNKPLAIVEAKDTSHNLGDGMQQALDYAEMLDIKFAYSSNGKAFLEHDLITGIERELSLDEFPSEETLWNRYKEELNISEQEEKYIEQPYYFGENSNRPRYYQEIAINRTIDAIARGQQRVLLVMATGTGKTFTAFQIIHRLRESGLKKKILYLADRNILIDQTMTNDFKPFKKVMTKVENRKMDSSYEIYMALYQQLSGDDNMEIFKQFKPEFFDLIIVDECHRGSAREDSRWRKILDYFSTATKIGLTATPKETKEVSNIDYFGKPIYTYSLKQGIDDGFLAPYKVIRVGLNKDLEGYRPEKGKLDIYGREIEDREYGQKDFDKNIIIDERTQMVAEKITEFLKNTNRMDKTIVFCIDIEHAERMRQALVNCNSDLCKKNSKYVMRITGDNAEGKAQLDNFIDPAKAYPTIVTTSKLMTTGVDCKTCKVIVLDNTFGENGMTEFKQIIGRGTRIREDYGKLYFTILDFRDASRMFADPNFNGPAICVLEPKEGEKLPPKEEVEPTSSNQPEDEGLVIEDPGYPGMIDDTNPGKKEKVRVRGVDVYVMSERVQYYDKDGKLITEDLKDYSKKNILKEYATLNDFLTKWNSDEKRKVIIEELKNQGILLDVLREEVNNPNLDDFDLICHIAYDKKPLTKSERARKVKQKGYFEKYSDKAKNVLMALLDKYASDGVADFEDRNILQLEEFRQFGNPISIVKLFGGLQGYLQAVRELKSQIYAA
ncbi:MAG: DEAD/DEAH box helicase family protein [Clostridia bacterium]|nr:DEAD/DEAH box helicase family protein [Clostridia bacterium]